MDTFAILALFFSLFIGGVVVLAVALTAQQSKRTAQAQWELRDAMERKAESEQ